MKTDGYILTPELLQWRYFHRPVVVQVLVYVLLSATHNEASAATLSLRLLADRLHTTVKAIRCAIDVLLQERIITKCSSPKASTMVYVNSSHPLSHCVIPYQGAIGAQTGALFGAQIGAQLGAQISTSQVFEAQGNAVYYQDGRGTNKGTNKGKDGALNGAHPKQGARRKAQTRAQINTLETPLNKGDTKDSEQAKGTDKGKGKGTEVRGKKETKETISPTPPIKENKERKQKAHTQTQKKEKEKKSLDAEFQFSEVLRLFNRLFLGTQVKPISKMTPDRKKMVAKFITDYSFGEVETMLRKALDSDLLSGRKDGGCYISFNWLFNPKNYEPLMEGTFDNPTVAASAEKKKPSKPQQEKTQVQSPPIPGSRPSVGERWQKAQQTQQSMEAHKDKVQRSVIMSNIADLTKNPRNKQALQALEQFYRDGTIQRLGIDWTPPVEEETQNLLRLDDQTQSYLQSLLSD